MASNQFIAGRVHADIYNFAKNSESGASLIYRDLVNRGLGDTKEAFDAQITSQQQAVNYFREIEDFKSAEQALLRMQALVEDSEFGAEIEGSIADQISSIRLDSSLDKLTHATEVVGNIAIGMAGMQAPGMALKYGKLLSAKLGISGWTGNVPGVTAFKSGWNHFTSVKANSPVYNLLKQQWKASPYVRPAYEAVSNAVRGPVTRNMVDDVVKKADNALGKVRRLRTEQAIGAADDIASNLDKLKGVADDALKAGDATAARRAFSKMSDLAANADDLFFQQAKLSQLGLNDYFRFALKQAKQATVMYNIFNPGAQWKEILGEAGEEVAGLLDSQGKAKYDFESLSAAFGILGRGRAASLKSIRRAQERTMNNFVKSSLETVNDRLGTPTGIYNNQRFTVEDIGIGSFTIRLADGSALTISDLQQVSAMQFDKEFSMLQASGQVALMTARIEAQIETQIEEESDFLDLNLEAVGNAVGIVMTQTANVEGGAGISLIDLHNALLTAPTPDKGSQAGQEISSELRNLASGLADMDFEAAPTAAAQRVIDLASRLNIDTQDSRGRPRSTNDLLSTIASKIGVPANRFSADPALLSLAISDQADYLANRVDSVTSSVQKIEALRQNIKTADAAVHAVELQRQRERTDIGPETQTSIEEDIDPIKGALAQSLSRLSQEEAALESEADQLRRRVAELEAIELTPEQEEDLYNFRRRLANKELEILRTQLAAAQAEYQLSLAENAEEAALREALNRVKAKEIEAFEKQIDIANNELARINSLLETATEEERKLLIPRKFALESEIFSLINSRNLKQAEITIADTDVQLRLDEIDNQINTYDQIIARFNAELTNPNVQLIPEQRAALQTQIQRAEQTRQQLASEREGIVGDLAIELNSAVQVEFEAAKLDIAEDFIERLGLSQEQAEEDAHIFLNWIARERGLNPQEAAAALEAEVPILSDFQEHQQARQEERAGPEAHLDTADRLNLAPSLTVAGKEKDGVYYVPTGQIMVDMDAITSDAFREEAAALRQGIIDKAAQEGIELTEEQIDQQVEALLIEIVFVHEVAHMLAPTDELLAEAIARTALGLKLPLDIIRQISKDAQTVSDIDYIRQNADKLLGIDPAEVGNLIDKLAENAQNPDQRTFLGFIKAEIQKELDAAIEIDDTAERGRLESIIKQLDMSLNKIIDIGLEPGPILDPAELAPAPEEEIDIPPGLAEDIGLEEEAILEAPAKVEISPGEPPSLDAKFSTFEQAAELLNELYPVPDIQAEIAAEAAKPTSEGLSEAEILQRAIANVIGRYEQIRENALRNPRIDTFQQQQDARGKTRVMATTWEENGLAYKQTLSQEQKEAIRALLNEKYRQNWNLEDLTFGEALKAINRFGYSVDDKGNMYRNVLSTDWTEDKDGNPVKIQFNDLITRDLEQILPGLEPFEVNPGKPFNSLAGTNEKSSHDDGTVVKNMQIRLFDIVLANRIKNRFNQLAAQDPELPGLAIESLEGIVVAGAKTGAKGFVFADEAAAEGKDAEINDLWNRVAEEEMQKLIDTGVLDAALLGEGLTAEEHELMFADTNAAELARIRDVLPEIEVTGLRTARAVSDTAKSAFKTAGFAHGGFARGNVFIGRKHTSAAISADDLKTATRFFFDYLFFPEGILTTIDDQPSLNDQLTDAILALRGATEEEAQQALDNLHEISLKIRHKTDIVPQTGALNMGVGRRTATEQKPAVTGAEESTMYNVEIVDGQPVIMPYFSDINGFSPFNHKHNAILSIAVHGMYQGMTIDQIRADIAREGITMPQQIDNLLFNPDPEIGLYSNIEALRATQDVTLEDIFARVDVGAFADQIMKRMNQIAQEIVAARGTINDQVLQEIISTTDEIIPAEYGERGTRAYSTINPEILARFQTVDNVLKLHGMSLQEYLDILIQGPKDTDTEKFQLKDVAPGEKAGYVKLIDIGAESKVGIIEITKIKPDGTFAKEQFGVKIEPGALVKLPSVKAAQDIIKEQAPVIEITPEVPVVEAPAPVTPITDLLSPDTLPQHTELIGEGRTAFVHRITTPEFLRSTWLAVTGETITEQEAQQKIDEGILIKILKPVSPARLNTFLDIGGDKLMTGVVHPNIATIFGVTSATIQGQERGIVLQQEAKGIDLSELEFKDGQFEYQGESIPIGMNTFLLEMAAQLEAAIMESGSRGVAHRDIKPENIKLTWDGPRPIFTIIDFTDGSADGTVQERGLRGSPGFYAPAHVDPNGFVDFNGDLFSLAASFYNMVSGKFFLQDYAFAIIGEDPATVSPTEAVWDLGISALEAEKSDLIRKLGFIKNALEQQGLSPVLVNKLTGLFARGMYIQKGDIFYENGILPDGRFQTLDEIVNNLDTIHQELLGQPIPEAELWQTTPETPTRPELDETTEAPPSAIPVIEVTPEVPARITPEGQEILPLLDEFAPLLRERKTNIESRIQQNQEIPQADILFIEGIIADYKESLGPNHPTVQTLNNLKDLIEAYNEKIAPDLEARKQELIATLASFGMQLSDEYAEALASVDLGLADEGILKQFPELIQDMHYSARKGELDYFFDELVREVYLDILPGRYQIVGGFYTLPAQIIANGVPILYRPLFSRSNLLTTAPTTLQRETVNGLLQSLTELENLGKLVEIYGNELIIDISREDVHIDLNQLIINKLNKLGITGIYLDTAAERGALLTIGDLSRHPRYSTLFEGVDLEEMGISEEEPVIPFIQQGRNKVPIQTIYNILNLIQNFEQEQIAAERQQEAVNEAWEELCV